MPRGHPADPFRTNKAAWDTGALLPHRYRPDPEQVQVDPPRIEDVIDGVWGRWRPVLRRAVRCAGRNVVVLAGVVAAVVGVAHLRADHQRTLSDRYWEARRAELVTPASRDVEDVLAIIGHGTRINSIDVSYRPEYIGGSYDARWRSLAINLNADWEREDMLDLVAHECVHALFDQAGLSGYWTSLEHQIVEETAAYVLGAHVEGRVLTLRGGDGERCTRAKVAEYRSLCKVDSPDSAKRRFVRRVLKGDLLKVDPDEVWGIMSHFGNERIVDEIDEICTRVGDPWDAAHEIAERYKLYFKWNPALVPEP